MVNYQNGKIYKIINENNEVIYIGSTVQELSQRYTTHTHKSPNHKIILIEKNPCNSKEELIKREQEIIDEYPNLLNKCRAYTSTEDKLKQQKLYVDNNIEYVKQYRQNYYKQHNQKPDVIKRKREYYQNNKIKCEFCNIETYRNNLKKHLNTKKCLKIQENLKQN